MDYAALAAQYGGTSTPPAPSGGAVDYAKLAAQYGGTTATPAKPVTAADMWKREIMGSLPGGVARGIKDVIDTGAGFISRLGGADEQARVRAENDAGKADFAKTTEGMPAAGAGRLIGNIVATAPVGGVIAAGLSKVPGVAAAAPNLLNAIRTSGMQAGSSNALANAFLRAAGGATAGAASAGLVNPEDAGTGAMIGAVAPGALQAVGAAGKLIGRGAKAIAGAPTPEVAALAKRAGELGIDIPADRLVNSKPLDAVASGLNYVPFSGRAATEAKMAEQLNRAGSRLVGQDTPNMTQALRKADAALGAKFESTLSKTGVAFDKQLLDDVTAVFNTAEKELGSDALKAISSQVDELASKGATGVIDGQAAYNIKRTLDRIGRRNSPEAWHALELKGKLMDALNRSLGPDEAAAFATTRQQYGNMLALEKLARNGVEGEISVARLANLKNINNQPLQELADIAAQFVKPREGQHGAMQRAVAGGTAFAMGGVPGLAAGAGIGRGTNMLLNSNALRGAMLGEPNALRALTDPRLHQLLLQAAPQASGQ